MDGEFIKQMKSNPHFAFVIEEREGRRAPKLNSTPLWNHYFSKLPVGTVGTLTVILKKPTRSEQQLRYYFVLVGFIAEYTGHTDDEIHDALMRLKFGVKEVKLGSDIVEVRKSISNSARMTKTECMELIEFALEKCSELNINVPSKESLGYISNY